MGGISPAGSNNSNPVSRTSSVDDILAECTEYTNSSTSCSRQISMWSDSDSLTLPGSVSSSGQSSLCINRVISGEFTDAFSPPLPEKKSCHVKTDNSGTSPHTRDSFSRYSQLSQEGMSCGTVIRHSHSSEFQTLRQDGGQFVSQFVSSHVGGVCMKTFESSAVQNTDAAQNIAPPLPPKLKHS
jgi:hypothetical protein